LKSQIDTFVDVGVVEKAEVFGQQMVNVIAEKSDTQSNKKLRLLAESS